MEMLQVVQAYKTVTIFACMLCSSSDGVSDSRTCFFVAFFFVDRLVRGLRFERKSGRVEREVKYLGNVFFRLAGLTVYLLPIRICTKLI